MRAVLRLVSISVALLAPAVLLVIPASCNPPRTDTPVDAYLAFVRAAQKGDQKAVYAGLSAPTQQALQARAQQVSQASGGAIKADPASMILAAGPRPSPPTEVTLLRQDGQGAAVVRVTSEQGSSEVHMLKEPSGWKVDLMAALNR